METLLYRRQGEPRPHFDLASGERPDGSGPPQQTLSLGGARETAASTVASSRLMVRCPPSAATTVWSRTARSARGSSTPSRHVLVVSSSAPWKSTSAARTRRRCAMRRVLSGPAHRDLQRPALVSAPALGNLRVRRLARGVEDGYRSPLVQPGPRKSSEDADSAWRRRSPFAASCLAFCSWSRSQPVPRVDDDADLDLALEIAAQGDLNTRTTGLAIKTMLWMDHPRPQFRQSRRRHWRNWRPVGRSPPRLDRGSLHRRARPGPPSAASERGVT